MFEVCRELEGEVKNGDIVSGTPGDDNIEAIYSIYSPQVLRFLLGKGLDREAAEDLTQEVFFRLLRSGKEMRDGEYLRNLVFRVAQNLTIDHFRKNNGSVQERVTQDGLVGKDHPDLVTPLSPEDMVISSETRSDVISALSGLSDRHTEAIVLRELHGLSYREMASQMGISEKAAESLLHRARVHFKSQLVEAGERRGGWWSGIGLVLRGLPGRASRALRLASGKAAGVFAGAGGLGGVGSLVNVALVVLLVGSAICAGVACADGIKESRRSAWNAPVAGKTETAVPQGGETEKRRSVEPEEAEAVSAGGPIESQEPAAAEGADEQEAGIAGLLLGTTGDIADKLLGNVGGLLQTVTSPLLDLVTAVGVPPVVVSTLKEIVGLEATRQLTGDLLNTLAVAGDGVENLVGSTLQTIKDPLEPGRRASEDSEGAQALPEARDAGQPRGQTRQEPEGDRAPDATPAPAQAPSPAPAPAKPVVQDESDAPPVDVEQQTNIVQDLLEFITRDVLRLR